MHRRRAHLFEPILSELNPSIYEQPLKQMLYDLGEIYADIMDIYLAQLQAAEQQGVQTIDKIVKKVNESYVICSEHGY